ncbi:branched-chain amino acid transaminase [Georgenia yuyongxinii]|nr:branched-chain amino acid transaminase [Georgenia yuyongxinii]
MTDVVLMGDKYVPAAEATISVRTMAFNSGWSVFEGIRAYWNEEEKQLFVFRLPEHLQRLHNSARILRMELPADIDEMVERCRSLLERNNLREDSYLRPIAYKGLPTKLGVNLLDAVDEFVAYCFPQGRYLPTERGLSVGVSSWVRIQDNAAPPRAKIGGTYVNPALAKTDSLLQGFDEALMLTSEGNVAEGSTSNLFLVVGGELVTPPSTEDILVGITRGTIMEIAEEEFGLKVRERVVDRSELYSVDEAFLCGTGAEVAAIGSVDGRKIGDGNIGPITRRLQEFYLDMVRGKNPKYRHWCTPVHTSAAGTSERELSSTVVK